jgi:four helix bundle protein
MSNIAEGFGRRSRPDFAHFLVIAKGSCGEVRAQLLVAFDQQYLTEQQHATFRAQTKQISAGLANLARYLRNPKHAKKSETGVPL